nr:response regulator transcription factor [uncultured Carboxylicivirga sp.]
MSINIAIIYNHQLWGDALHSLINNKKGFRVSKVFAERKIKVWANEKDSICLMEGTYPDALVLNNLKKLKKIGLKVIFVGYLLDNEFVELLLNEGVDGYVLKTCCKDSLFEAIQRVDSGTKYFCGPVTEVLSGRLMAKHTKPLLTHREQEVLVEIVCMKKSHEIAESLNISVATVRTHRKNIMRKFGSKNYLGLLRYACREGILDAPGEKFCVGCKKSKCESAQIGYS